VQLVSLGCVGAGMLGVGMGLSVGAGMLSVGAGSGLS